MVNISLNDNNHPARSDLSLWWRAHSASARLARNWRHCWEDRSSRPGVRRRQGHSEQISWFKKRGERRQSHLAALQTLRLQDEIYQGARA